LVVRLLAGEVGIEDESRRGDVDEVLAERERRTVGEDKEKVGPRPSIREPALLLTPRARASCAAATA